MCAGLQTPPWLLRWFLPVHVFNVARQGLPVLQTLVSALKSPRTLRHVTGSEVPTQTCAASSFLLLCLTVRHVTKESFL